MPFSELPDRIITPPDHLSITRYFTESKFLSLLETSSLYFAKISKFPKSDEIGLSVSDMNWMRSHSKGADKQLGYYEEEKKSSYINCWSHEGRDWRRFWEVYGNSSNAVMLKVSVGKLKKELEKSEKTIYMPVVHYFDIINEPLRIFNSIKMLSRKPSDFKWEKEIRLLIYHFPSKDVLPEFILIPVTLAEIIEQIVVSPFASEQFYNLVEGVIIENGINPQILSKSEMKIK